MAKEESIHSGDIGRNQAIDQDYRDAAGLDRGHLCPSGHRSPQKNATFTLTNIVPQYMTLNQGAWKQYEDTTMPQKTRDCVKTYVITVLTPFPLLPLVNKLVNIDFGKEMAEESSIKSGNIGQNQAIDEDYSTALMPVDRGHLCPSSHLSGQHSTRATFTLTNIVPQYRTLNQGAWSNYEGYTMRENTQGCDTTYVITGAVPGNTNTTNGRVNIPSHIWSAACCVSKNEPIKAWGAIAENQIHNNLKLFCRFLGS
ncbi:PREDICTED: uncharacterized protein LOC101822231 [Ficedula albicollis]|uniref:uncharacterized protein LOC101822231 n=1 Tax=Ficedula albicollis TaxID=59894 RepID=UPI0007AD8348|nr:PREDICTED: uncharacterized protein LOC101822231 [Ficedula albicollis]